MNKEIAELANECGFTILNSPIWRAQGEKFLNQLLLMRAVNGQPLLFTLVQRPLTADEAKDFIR